MGAFAEYEKRIEALQLQLFAVVRAANASAARRGAKLYVPRVAVEDVRGMVLECEEHPHLDAVSYRLLPKPETVDVTATTQGTDLVVANGR